MMGQLCRVGVLAHRLTGAGQNGGRVRSPYELSEMPLIPAFSPEYQGFFRPS